VTEQRYKAVLAVIGDGRTVDEVARDWGVSRRTMHRWLARYEGDGLEGLNNRSHRPDRCLHQTSPAVEAMVLEMRRAHSYWGARRIAFELARKRVEPAPSESAVYRCLVRAAVIDPMTRRRRRETWKRWERGGPMELWQLDVVHGFLLADGSSAKARTGIDDHSRYCVSARLMASERTQSVSDGFNSAMQAFGVPLQVLTDNGKVFTGRFAQPPVEVLFDRICRENGVDHILTQPRSPTTTGKIERFHRTLRVEFNWESDTSTELDSRHINRRSTPESISKFKLTRRAPARERLTTAALQRRHLGEAAVHVDRTGITGLYSGCEDSHLYSDPTLSGCGETGAQAWRVSQPALCPSSREAARSRPRR
jgi:transposase InsO family protein